MSLHRSPGSSSPRHSSAGDESVFLCPFVCWLQSYKTILKLQHKETTKDIFAEKDRHDGRPIIYNNVEKQRAGTESEDVMGFWGSNHPVESKLENGAPLILRGLCDGSTICVYHAI